MAGLLGAWVDRPVWLHGRVPWPYADMQHVSAYARAWVHTFSLVPTMFDCPARIHTSMSALLELLACSTRFVLAGTFTLKVMSSREMSTNAVTLTFRKFHWSIPPPPAQAPLNFIDAIDVCTHVWESVTTHFFTQSRGIINRQRDRQRRSSCVLTRRAAREIYA